LPFRDARMHLGDILGAIGLIEVFLTDMDFEAYERDLKTKSAVERQMQIITEAAHRLGPQADIVCPGPDWKGYAGMGNILRHAYHRVNDRIVWDTAKIDLPRLKQAVLGALSEASSPPMG
jgi:uncharacterized protein with HEPN domain